MGAPGRTIKHRSEAHYSTKALHSEVMKVNKADFDAALGKLIATPPIPASEIEGKRRPKAGAKKKPPKRSR